MHFCLFDIDGTLLNSGGAGKIAIETALTEDFGVTIRTHVPFSGRTDRAIARDLMHFHDIAVTPENAQRLVRGYLQRLPAALAAHNGRVLPGIVSLLSALDERDDVAVGLLTGNIREGARVKLGHYSLYEHFTFGGFGDHHFERDDVARDALAEIHQRYGTAVLPERVWVIGDTPLDVQCARAIGARAVAVATGLHTVDQLRATEPDLLVADLADHAPFLGLL
jgi:phosphoglycolate phosphatase-like HAD superfamily hydrolase